MVLSSIIFLGAGFVALIKGADWLVDGASSIAKRLGVSDLVIGLTIVAFGTSAPELVVNMLSAWKGTTDIALGNIIGSNIVNILFILGLSAIIFPLAVKKSTVRAEIPLAVLAALMVLFMANDVWFEGASQSLITRIDGLGLLAFFAVFLFYTYRLSKSGRSEDMEVKHWPIMLSVAAIGGGLVALVVGGRWIVNSAVELATSLGVSQSIIGLTIVAIGTSLPELATSLVAAWRRNTDIAVGNIVGSNIFNVFLILGLSSVIAPLPSMPHINADIAVMIAASVALFAAMFLGHRRRLDRWQGVLFVLSYFGYIAYLIVR